MRGASLGLHLGLRIAAENKVVAIPLTKKTIVRASPIGCSLFLFRQRPVGAGV